ncbi:MAG: hypothetical protein HONBIEJF_00366 [Fimbriimonadaceae bacterium]|nr:hypothetical protein [Fimbriimonadaceae bacterium]
MASTMLAIAFGVVLSLSPGVPPLQAAFNFRGQAYVARYSKGNLSEFTPKGQSDLKKWTDMITINDYPHVRDGDGLAQAANGVLETYKQDQALVVNTSSVPRTEKRPAEHLIVVVFGRPDFQEAAFARFVMNGKAGASLVYSHRIYGAKVGEAMSQWLKQNGPKVEKELMAMKMPDRTKTK